MRLYLFISIFFFIASCNSPVDKTKICDQKSIGYKLELLRKIVMNDRSAYCYFGSSFPPPIENISLTSDTVSPTTISPILIAKNRVIGFTNTVPMSASCEVKLNTTVIIPTVTLSADKKTFSLTPPSAGWTLDVENPLTFQFQNCKTAAGSEVLLPGTGVNLFVAEKVIYVDSVSGNDSNAGTNTAPMKSISAALTSASTACSDRCAIGVKGGNYPIDGTITMPTNTSIFGGFDPADWTKRRADKTLLSPYDTILTDTITNILPANAPNTSPYSTLKYISYSGLQNKSIIDGIIVNGPVSAGSGSFIGVIGSVDLQVGAGFIIRNTVTNDLCSSIGVTSAGFDSINNSGKINLFNSKFMGSTVIATTTTRLGIVHSGSTATADFSASDSEINSGTSSQSNAGFLMANTNFGKIALNKNIIVGGNSGADSKGIQVTFATASGMTITENTITSGTGTNSFGIETTTGTGLSITKNMITTGAATTSSMAIRIASTGGTSLTASENTITTGTGTNSYGIDSLSGSNILFDKNIMNIGSGTTNTRAIAINGTVTSPVTISNNTINIGNSSSTGIIYGIEKGINGVTLNIDTNTITMPSCGINCSGNRALQLGGGTGTGASIITNNIINGGSGGGASAIAFNNDATYTLINNTITGPICANANCIAYGIEMSFGVNATLTNNSVTMQACTGANCTQIAMRSGNGLLYNLTGNTIDSGPSSVTTISRIGMNLENWATNSSIQGNTIISRIGVGTPIAVNFPANIGNSLRFCSNVVIGGGRTNAGSAYALQMALLTGSPKFMGNTIIAPTIVSGGIAAAVNFTATGAHTGLKLDQNIFYGNGPLTNCVNDTAGANYATLAKNSFTSCTNVFYRRVAANHDTLCSGNFGQGGCPGAGLLSTPAGLNNVTNTPVFTNFATNDLRLTAATPVSILNGMAATDLTVFTTECGNSLDRDGATRTDGSAIGAYK